MNTTDQMKLETTEEALRNALEWYGEQARLARLVHSEGDPGRWALAEDGGKRAREVLAMSAIEPAGVGVETQPPSTHLRGEPVAWRVRVKSDDPEEWSLLPAGGGADYLNREGYECQPLYVLSTEGK